jgi:hypothetical protein
LKEEVLSLTLINPLGELALLRDDAMLADSIINYYPSGAPLITYKSL